MGKGKWIWFPGDYEIYHNLQLHARRYQRGVYIPAQWGLATPYPGIQFMQEIRLQNASEQPQKQSVAEPSE